MGVLQNTFLLMQRPNGMLRVYIKDSQQGFSRPSRMQAPIVVLTTSPVYAVPGNKLYSICHDESCYPYDRFQDIR